ncbi:MAG: RidA family protein [Saprospiraceae bacterium]|nr:RidA family protein [Saprospiraceae bacterium]
MKSIIKTADAPLPIGPYNQAIKANGCLYVSGQIAINPADGSLVNNTLEEEAHQVLKNLGAILKAAGLGYEDVVKSTVFIKDMHQFARVNAVYGEYFPADTAPARETVEVANLPKFVQIEISVIAVY